MCFGCSKEPSHRDGSFEYPQHMFWLRNKKKIIFSLGACVIQPLPVQHDTFKNDIDLKVRSSNSIYMNKNDEPRDSSIQASALK